MLTTILKIRSVLRREEKKRLWILIFLDILISILDITFLALLLLVIHFYTRQAATGQAPYRQNALLSNWFSGRDPRTLISFFLILFTLKSVAGYLVLRVRFRFVYQVATRMSEENLLNYLEGNFHDYVNVDSAVQMRRISQQPIEFCHHILAGLMQVVTEGVLIILTVAGILWYDVRLFLLLLSILLPAIIILSYISKKRLRSARDQVKASGEKTLQYLQETLSGYVESNIYDRNRYFTGRYTGYQRNMNHFLAELQITQGIPSRLIEVFAVFGLFILISFQATAFFALGAFIAAAYKIIPGMVRLSNTSGQMRTYSFTLHDMVQQQALIQQTRTEKRARDSGSPEMIRSIKFDRVSYGHKGQHRNRRQNENNGQNENSRQNENNGQYWNNEKELMKDLTFCMKTGDFLGISGLSGKGKTTIINLLLGFLEPDKGNIMVNEELATAPERKRNWKRIAYVKQQAFLLHGSLLHNITLGEDNFDEQKMRCALHRSGLEDWAGPFPGCLGKLVTEQGKNISGGQRQRIVIARALYKDADLILLDEPFNELDRASELHLLQHFTEICREGKMVMLITHHKESFSFCNKLVSLNSLVK